MLSQALKSRFVNTTNCPREALSLGRRSDTHTGGTPVYPAGETPALLGAPASAGRSRRRLGGAQGQTRVCFR